MAKMGASEINLADTVGYANPNQVKSLFSELKNQIGCTPMAAHFHDTRGMGLANVVAALQEGVRRFDATMAGLGGCPFAPGASGNIATEDCAYLLESLGFDTSVDFDKLLELRSYLSNLLPHEKLEGRLGFAGKAINFKNKLL
jgi:hydroxymethylglutaryl-CoA lyase